MNTNRSFSCAQIKVVGGGNGTPGPTIKFPGGYKKDDPSFNFSIWNGYKDYPLPGPAIWTGASGSTPAQVPNVGAAAPANVPTSDEEEENMCADHHWRAHPRAFKH